MAIFDTKADSYDDWYNTELGRFADRVETECAFSMLSLEQKGKALDVGCGSGNFSIKLAKAGFDVTGVDMSDKMLDKARLKIKNLNLSVKFLQGDVLNLNFADNTFDIVISMAAFEFIEDTTSALREMLRVAKPSAPVIVGTINRDSPWGKLYLEKALNGHDLFKHAFFKCPDDFKKLLPEYLKTFRQCLFLPPDTKPEDVSHELDMRLSKVNNGGFFCAKWAMP